MAAASTSASPVIDPLASMKFHFQNQEAVRLDRSNGTNYNWWKDKKVFILTTLKIYYILDPNLQPIPEPTPESTDEIKTHKD